MHHDLTALRSLVRSGAASGRQAVEQSLERAQDPRFAPAFTRLMVDSARAEASRPGLAERPLAGLPVSVKDLFDVAGLPTCAGSVVLADAAPATRDAPAVARLRQAGGVLLGTTHMVEFAFSGVGTNPHGPAVVAWDGRYGAIAGAPRVPGGSSSGAAVSVACGAAWIGLGSDTGGSIRIPAALNGVVGFKSTARLVPTAGTIPLSTTLDTACAITRTVRDAVLAHEILAQRSVTPSPAPLSAWRLAVPRTVMLDGLDNHVARVFDRTLAHLQAAGARIDTIDLPLLARQPAYGFSAPEAYAWHRDLIARAGDRYDPRVRQRILKGAELSAADYIALQRERAAWIAGMERAMQGYDALLSPTVPIVAPLLADVAPGQERDAAFFAANAQLLRNTSVVNLLDGCALSLPCHTAGELPVGLMVWHAALHDDAVLAVSGRIEEALQK
ncbi:MAG: amidase [Burkholderiaceae bacterium]